MQHANNAKLQCEIKKLFGFCFWNIKPGAMDTN